MFLFDPILQRLECEQRQDWWSINFPKGGKNRGSIEEGWVGKDEECGGDSKQEEESRVRALAEGIQEEREQDQRPITHRPFLPHLFRGSGLRFSQSPATNKTWGLDEVDQLAGGQDVVLPGTPRWAGEQINLAHKGILDQARKRSKEYHQHKGLP